MQEYKGEWHVIMWKRDKSKANTGGLQHRERERESERLGRENGRT